MFARSYSPAFVAALIFAAPGLARPLTSAPARRSAQSASSAVPSPSPPAAGETPRPFAEGVYISGACPRPVRRCIAFTFDDGPSPAVTPQILAILDEHHLHATFFVEGQHLDAATDPNAPTNRDLLRDAIHRGNLVGNHTYDHPVLNRLDDAHLATEIDRTSELIADTLGQRPGFFRAPYGMLGTARAIRAVAGRGYTLTRWILDPRDWAEHDAESVLRNFRWALHSHPDGGVLLMHDVHAHTPEAFRLILAEIDRQNVLARRRGEPTYQLLTLDQFYRPQRGRAAH